MPAPLTAGALALKSGIARSATEATGIKWWTNVARSPLSQPGEWEQH